ncbi:MAG: hypothetical protein LBT29_07770 [Flavobacteriaceae bacterium]|nr:hypothetical protein [Flavobacteriaceae bacterium]
MIHHIQEDAFISWRVAQNILDYGVMGYNGEEKISASTTYGYVFLSLIFNVIFGKANFIFPLLIFNTLLFTAGSYRLSQLFFEENKKRFWFTALLAFIPPALKASYLGMEYALVFFLYTNFLYFGLEKSKKWAYWIFPVLLIWTRLDAVIFLGITFLMELIFRKKWNWNFVFGGIVGLGSVLAFNYLYFNQWVNNTIIAKSLAYEQPATWSKRWAFIKVQILNFLGVIKVPVPYFNFTTVIFFATEFICFFILLVKKDKQRIFLWILLLFSLVKMLIFQYELSNFDWYYWIPQIFLFSFILLYIVDLQRPKRWIAAYIIVLGIPMFGYQLIHSIATANGEWNYRRKIGIDLGNMEADKSKTIFLEPAGYVPYFSGLKTIDFVGLVDKRIQHEFLTDKKNAFYHMIFKYHPDYILAMDSFDWDNQLSPEQKTYLNAHYQFVKEYKISDHLDSNYLIIKKIYQIKPSGINYCLYKLKN